MSRTSKRNRKRHRRQRRYYLTPKAWNRRCTHCGGGSSIAYRYPTTFACFDCIERLGIVAHESKAWIEGGAKAGQEVRVRNLEPPDEGWTGPT